MWTISKLECGILSSHKGVGEMKFSDPSKSLNLFVVFDPPPDKFIKRS